MTQESLGRAQALLTIVAILGILVILLCQGIARARGQRFTSWATATAAQRLWIWIVVVFIIAVGVALTFIALLQFFLAREFWSLLGIFIGIAIIYKIVSVIRKTITEETTPRAE